MIKTLKAFSQTCLSRVCHQMLSLDGGERSKVRSHQICDRRDVFMCRSEKIMLFSVGEREREQDVFTKKCPELARSKDSSYPQHITYTNKYAEKSHFFLLSAVCVCVQYTSVATREQQLCYILCQWRLCICVTSNILYTTCLDYALTALLCTQPSLVWGLSAYFLIQHQSRIALPLWLCN